MVPTAMASYGSTVARIALHGPPNVVEAWRRFQDDVTTTTDDGRARLVQAIQAARGQLGHGLVSDENLHVLLFGPRGTGPVEFEFQRILSGLQAQVGAAASPELGQEPAITAATEDLASTITQDPAMAVFTGYVRLERALYELLRSAGQASDGRRSSRELARQAANLGLIAPETLNAFEGLTVLRNLVAHGRSDEVTEDRARDYLALVDALLYAIRQGPKR
jgi:hypothetical protein